MNLGDIAKLAGLDEKKVTFDYAVPQTWADAVRPFQIEPRLFVWVYDNGSMSGRPLPVGEMMLDAVKNGNLIPSDILENIVDMAKDGKSLDEIKELVKLHCESL